MTKRRSNLWHVGVSLTLLVGWGAAGCGDDDNDGGDQAVGGSSVAGKGGSSPKAGSSAGGDSTVAGSSDGGSTAAAGASAGGAAGSAGSSAGGAAGSSAGGAAGSSAGGADNPGGSAGSSVGGAGSSGEGGAAGESSEAEVLDQTGNPAYEKVNYASWLSTAADDATKLAEDKVKADNIISWQLPNGGFGKHAAAVYDAPWDGTAARSDWRGASDVELGTLDNTGTVMELLVLADVYGRSSEVTYRDAAREAFDFILTMQHASGGFPQVYPERTGTTYSNYITFNDDAMVRALLVLDGAVKQKPPLDGDLFTPEQLEGAEQAIAKAVDYILNAQIVQDGVKTVWCAQHDPQTYEPRGARSYELPSKSGKESASIVGFLMTQPQTAELKAAVLAALAWYRSDAVSEADTAYVKRPPGNTDDTYNPIQTRAGSTMWYRFYELDSDVPFFSGRLPTDNPAGVGKKFDIMEIEAERRYGYEWGGSYGAKILAYAATVGY